MESRGDVTRALLAAAESPEHRAAILKRINANPKRLDQIAAHHREIQAGPRRRTLAQHKTIRTVRSRAVAAVRVRHANRQPRARAAKRSPGRATSGSRDGPHLGDDDPPPLASDFHPHQGATAVRQAFGYALRGAP